MYWYPQNTESLLVLIYLSNKTEEGVTSKDKLEYINFIILIKIVSPVTHKLAVVICDNLSWTYF